MLSNLIYQKDNNGITLLKRALDTIEETQQYEEELFRAFTDGKRPPKKQSMIEKEGIQELIKKFEKYQRMAGKM